MIEIKVPDEPQGDYISRQAVYELIGTLKMGDVRAMEKLRRGLEKLPSEEGYNKGYADGVEAYKAMMELEKEEKEEDAEDCISRQAVDEYITNLLSGYLYDEERTRLEDLTAYIWELPSVTPKAESKDEYKKGYSDGFRDCLDKNVFCIESEEEENELNRVKAELKPN